MSAARALGVALLLPALVLGAACSGDGGDETAATVTAVDPAVLVRAAADRMEQVETFHFVLEHENGSTEIVRGVEMTGAEGDIAGSDRVRTTVEGSLGPLNFELGIVILPDEQWFQNPLTGRWERESIDIAELFDPADGIVALMRAVESPVVDGRERIDGVDTYRVVTAVDAGDLAIFPGATAGLEVEAVAWIGVEEPYVYRLEARGPIAGGEDGQIVRRLELSRFDEDVEIAPPR